MMYGKIVVSLVFMIGNCCQGMSYYNAKDYTGSYVSRFDMTILTASSPQINQIIQNSGAIPPVMSGWSLNTTKGVAGYQAFVAGGQTSNPAITACVVDSSNKIVIVGNSFDAYNSFLAVRLTANGVLDTAFNTSGSLVFNPTGASSTLYSVINGPTGSYYVAGTGTGPTKGYISAITSAGILNTSFGTSGYFSTTEVSSIVSIAAQAQGGNAGKIVFAGPHATTNTYVGRATSAGLVDGSFLYSAAGIVPVAVAVDSNDKVIVAMSDTSDITVVRLLSNGTLDTSFGVSGVYTTPFTCHAMALDSQNRIYIAGQNFDVVKSFYVSRLTASGALDTTFGTNGYVTQSLNGGAGDNVATAVTILPNGEVAVAGTVTSGLGATSFGTMLLTSAGALDTSFSISGQTTVPGTAVVQPGGIPCTPSGIGYQTTSGNAGLVVTGHNTSNQLAAVFYLNS